MIQIVYLMWIHNVDSLTPQRWCDPSADTITKVSKHHRFLWFWLWCCGQPFKQWPTKRLVGPQDTNNLQQTKATFTLMRVRVSFYGSYKLHPYETKSGAFMVTCTRTTKRVSTDNLQSNRIKRMVCKKVTIFHNIINNVTNHAPLSMSNSTLT